MGRSIKSERHSQRFGKTRNTAAPNRTVWICLVIRQLMFRSCSTKPLVSDGSPGALPDCSPRLLAQIALPDCSPRLLFQIALPDCSHRLPSQIALPSCSHRLLCQFPLPDCSPRLLSQIALPDCSARLLSQIWAQGP